LKPVNATQRLRLGGIVSEFYQAYLNAFSPSLYYNANTTATTTGSLAIPVARACVSLVHAVALGTLLCLLAALIVVTLLKEPAPFPGGHALKLYSSTISDHLMASTGHLHKVIRLLSGMKDEHIKSFLSGIRFSMDPTGAIVVDNHPSLNFSVQPETGRSPIPICNEIIAQFSTLFGQNPAYAGSVILTGTFKPNSIAATLSNASHLTQPSTPITARFSSSTGIPSPLDNDLNSNPCEFSVRFHTGAGIHTDIISYSTPSFPTRTGSEFLELVLSAIASCIPGVKSPTPLDKFLDTHPAALAFVQMQKPLPTSFAQEHYFGLNAVNFINSEGTVHSGRYSIIPDAGVIHLSDNAAQSNHSKFLFDDLQKRITDGPITFQLCVQLANDGDIVDDVTVRWPEDRSIVKLGTLTLNGIVSESDREGNRLVFDPSPHIQGIEPSNDPLLTFRSAIYLSGQHNSIPQDV
jgi:catalase